MAVETEVASAEDAVRDWLRSYLSESHLAQMAYAREVGTTQTTISRFLLGKQRLPLMLARFMYRTHPEVRPALLEWMSEDHGDESLSQDGAA